MATVKGDVHDIGKNIVGVVLGCNNYEVIDLGVMVPAEQILQTAIDEDADMIGLSGLITPSLDEMVYVAREMERREFRVPLLIGGATTSRQHTAVKIAPCYGRETVHVHDASRSVGVVSDLLDEKRRADFDARNRTDQERLRALHAEKQERPLISFERARQNRLELDWSADHVARPAFSGRRVVDDVSLADLVPYIDWQFFFTTWELRGKFPQILDHPEMGSAARELYDNGRELLDRIVRERLFDARGVYGFYPAASDGDDLILFGDDTRSSERVRFPMLRQQGKLPDGKPNRSLADFVAPRSSGAEDWIGAFAVSTGHGVAELVAEFEADHDDYSAILAKALADRLAEAYAELLHARARREWGYERGTEWSADDLIAERYRGIRPAFGYPACPDHTPKTALFELLDAPALGITLTESLAMAPAASVSGLYFGHRDARYFAVGRIERDQVEDYARRAGLTLAEAERWLGPSLAYDPD